jgi:hypothetical protein
MAIGTPAILKDNGPIATSGQTTISITSVTIPANTLVEVLVHCTNLNSTAVLAPTAVADNAGTPNSYTKDDAANHGTTNAVNETLWSFYDSSGGTRTITVTLASSCNYTHAVVTGISGADSSTPLDTVGGGDAGTTTAVSIVSTANVAQADEASLVGLAWATATALSVWPPTNYTSLFNTTNGTRTHGHAGAYHTPLTSGAAETASATMGSNTQWAGVMGAYMGAAAGGGGQTVTMTGLGTASSVGTATAVPGAVTATMTGLASASSFGTTTALPGGVNVPVNGLASAASFGSPGEATGPVSVPVTGLGSAGAFGTIGSPAAPTEHFDPAIHGGKHR